jgi:F1F0 ATPase subunit 2
MPLTLNDLEIIVSCLAGGMALGCLHFGGLWLTLQRFACTKVYGLMFILSFVLRSFVSLTGIYILGNGDWIAMAACLGGMLIMRRIFVVKLGHPQFSG